MKSTGGFAQAEWSPCRPHRFFVLPVFPLALTDGGGGDLHECRLWREHPSEEEEEEWVVAEGDHGLDHPEDGLVVSQQVLSGDMRGSSIY